MSPKSRPLITGTETLGDSGGMTAIMTGIVGFLRKFCHRSSGSSAVRTEGIPPASSVAAAGTC